MAMPLLLVEVADPLQLSTLAPRMPMIFGSEKNLDVSIIIRNQLGEDAEIIGIVARKQPTGGFFNVVSEKLTNCRTFR
jgi:hypothetical protein